MRSILLIFLFSSFLLSSCASGPSGDPVPSQVSSSSSDTSFSFYLEPKLHLTAKFQVLSADGQQTVYELPLPVHWDVRDLNRPDLGKEAQMFPKEGFKLSNLAKGDYLFRIAVSHQSETQGEIPIASIETKQSIVGGEERPLDFSKSPWNYQFDEDKDGFSNIAELTDGYYKDEMFSPSERLPWSSWNIVSTDPKDPNKHPTGPYLITPERIHPTSLDDTRNSILVGEILSVQAGTRFTIIHFASDGKTVKEKIDFSSKIDGSFEVPLKNSEQEDQVALVLTSKINGDQLPDLSTDESQSFGKLMKITYRPLKMVSCRTVKGTEPIVGSGYVLLEGEGISTNVAENIVCFPSSGSNIPFSCGGSGSGKGGFVQADEVSIDSQTSRTVTLKVKIPQNAISGFPRIHTTTVRGESYGECQKDQVVTVLQNGKTESDLYAPAIFPPYVALMGQTISIDIAMVNQGLREISSGTPIPYLTYISPNPVGAANDDEIINGVDHAIFPESPSLTQPRDGIGDLEKISSGLNKGDFVYPKFSQNQYFLSPVPLPSGKFPSALFKAQINPLDQNKNRSVTEQNYTNNSHAASYNTFIHYLDLYFSLLPPLRTINFNNLSLRFIEDSQCLIDHQKSGCLIPTDDAAKKLKRKDTFDISLGALTNKGTFPLNRDKVDPAKYTPNMESPLSTESSIYKNSLKLYSRKDYAEGLVDLKKVAATEIIEQANLLDQRTELPVLVHVYYSIDNTFERDTDTLIKCIGCEFCQDRLEQGETTEIKTLTLGPLDDETKYNADGWLFIVAETVQIDPKKVKKNEGIQYCAVSDEERQQMQAAGSAQGIPLSDFRSLDNIIRVKIHLEN